MSLAFEDWIDETKSASRYNGRTMNARTSPFYSVVNLKRHGTEKCKGCGKVMYKCHDILYGPFAINEIVNYTNLQPENMVDDLVIKKIFIDTYNRSLAFDLFRNEGIKSNKDWLFPPRCMQDNLYDYALFWYRYKAELLREEADTTDEEDKKERVI